MGHLWVLFAVLGLDILCFSFVMNHLVVALYWRMK